jgi:hypothetical protein
LDDENNKIEVEVECGERKMHFCALGHKKQAYIDIKNMYLL